ncbi:subtype B tannase [Streptomyces sp. YIM S03343]
MGIAAATATPAVAGWAASQASAGTTSDSSDSHSLVFDKDTYTEQTKTVSTEDGDKKVTYHFYSAIPYVANPVDTDYQSLNVSVPVAIDGTAVDATGAPILFSIGVGGYMSSPVSGGNGGGAPGGGAPSGTGVSPSASASVPSGSGAQVGGGQMISNADLALAAGYVVVAPGCRGRDNVTSGGTYYGKAPAAIVDLKAAVRYVRYNKGRIPGNTDWIVSSGSSAGGALSALLGASADSRLYDSYLKELGAAKASDAIFGSADYCPITDLEHADMAYEWMFGGTALDSSGAVVDQTVSKELSTAFARYQASLKLRGKDGFGKITAGRCADHLLQTYLEPAATTYLKALSDSDRSTYLSKNSWITWSDDKAAFTFTDFVEHVGRSKSVPAFDDFDLTSAETIEFGNETANARHFTPYSLRHTTGDDTAQLDADLPEKINLMNPMYFIRHRNPARAKNWWIRVGTSDTATSLTVVGNLAAGLENLGDNVNALMYWDGGHGSNEDAGDFMTWIGKVTGHTK